MDDNFYKQVIDESPTGYAYHRIICDRNPGHKSHNQWISNIFEFGGEFIWKIEITIK